jgi:hypothetical protein
VERNIKSAAGRGNKDKEKNCMFGEFLGVEWGLSVIDNSHHSGSGLSMGREYWLHFDSGFGASEVKDP